MVSAVTVVLALSGPAFVGTMTEDLLEFGVLGCFIQRRLGYGKGNVKWGGMIVILH